MTTRQITISTVAYDGYPLDVAFEQISGLGLKLVEPAYIKGYMDFSEVDFSDSAAETMRGKLAAHGLGAIAISAHMDNGAPDAVAMLERRIRFTAAIGAKFTITNATDTARRADLERCITANLPLAEALNIVIALENPGNGPDNLMRDGSSGATLVAAFDSPSLRMNYDTANALTCTEGAVRPEDDIVTTLSVSSHMHLKDVVRNAGTWQYTAIGSGEIDYPTLLRPLAKRKDIPLTIELPLRLRRAFHKDPQRTQNVPPLSDIAAAIKSSWACLSSAFDDLPTL